MINIWPTIFALGIKKIISNFLREITKKSRALKSKPQASVKSFGHLKSQIWLSA